MASRIDSMKLCPLHCGNKYCEIEHAGMGVYVVTCNHCFWFRYHESVMFQGVDIFDNVSPIPQKRANAIYNFLSKEIPNLYERNKNVDYFFAYDTNKINVDTVINVYELMHSYPCNHAEKLNAILENLTEEYDKTEFDINNIPSPLLYEEGDRAYWLNLLEEQKYILQSNNIKREDAFSHIHIWGVNAPQKKNTIFTLTHKAFDQVQKNQNKIKPKKFDNVDKKYRDTYLEAYQVLEASPKSCAFLCRSLLEMVLRERCGCEEFRLESKIKTFIEKCNPPSTLAETINYLKLAGDTVAHSKEHENIPIETTKDDCILLLKIVEMLFNCVFQPDENEFSKLDKYNVSNNQKK
ncbi:MAG: DUF4145 domain-containing protein [Firmicutes bacterium]|nr:DUF4145 domain-containing protein [Bacillota bacterium]